MAFQDIVKAQDAVSATTSQEVVAPLFPCNSCGKETKKDMEVGYRICSDQINCGKRQVWSDDPRPIPDE